MRKGDRVLLAWSSANRDPAQFEHPDEVVLDRWPNRHTAFGMGIHRCAGRPRRAGHRPRADRPGDPADARLRHRRERPADLRAPGRQCRLPAHPGHLHPAAPGPAVRAPDERVASSPARPRGRGRPRRDPAARPHRRQPAARDERDALAAAARARWRPSGRVRTEDRLVPGRDGDPDVRVRVHRPAGEASGAVLLWVHGGGHVLGSAEQDDPLLDAVVARTGPSRSPSTGAARPSTRIPAALHDCYAILAAAPAASRPASTRPGWSSAGPVPAAAWRRAGAARPRPR